MTPSSLRIDAGLAAVAAAGFVFAAVLMAPVVLGCGDLYWHIAAGRWMIDNQQILRINLFTYTNAAGDVWLNQDWLSQLALAGAYVGAGWSGVLLLAAIAVGTAAGLVGFFLVRGRRATIAGLWLVLALVTGGGAVEALPFLLALPFLVLWTGVVAAAGEKGPSLKLLPAMLVWANLSTSFIIGLVVTVVLAAEAILLAQERRSATARSWAVFTGFALVFSLITPTGALGLVHAARSLRPGGTVQTMLPLLVGLPASAMLLPQRRMILRWLLLAGLFALALTSEAARVAFAVTAPLLAAGPAERDVSAVPFKPLAALMLLAVTAAAMRLAIPLVRGDDAATPARALSAVPSSLKRQPVLNDRAFGGFLIFREIKPFIDGRPLYSAAFRRRYRESGEPGLLNQTLTRYHIRWTILKPDNPAVKALDGTAGWHRLYTDQWAVVHVKGDAH